MAKKKVPARKPAAAKRAAPKKKPTAERRKPAPTIELPPVPIIPEIELAAHFPAVEAAARAGELDVRPDVLDDPQKRTTVLAHLLLEYCGDRLAGRPPEAVFWTRFYWHHRLVRMHERLEHGGKRCPAYAQSDEEDYLLEDGIKLNVDLKCLDPVEARAKADASAALGPGPFKRPKFACGDIRPLGRGE
ncbi:MAG: hypothetical protein J2P46_10530 [Zavarzinella sp.]|nr:hypothetical protein [Zavarzinella sp.]